MDIESIVNQVPHSVILRRRCLKVDPAGNDYEDEEIHQLDCARCKLESYATSQREARKGLEKLRDDMRDHASHWAPFERFVVRLSAILEGKG